jgi:hypothetical protein
LFVSFQQKLTSSIPYRRIYDTHDTCTVRFNGQHSGRVQARCCRKYRRGDCEGAAKIFTPGFVFYSSLLITPVFGDRELQYITSAAVTRPPGIEDCFIPLKKRDCFLIHRIKKQVRIISSLKFLQKTRNRWNARPYASNQLASRPLRSNRQLDR